MPLEYPDDAVALLEKKLGVTDEKSEVDKRKATRPSLGSATTLANALRRRQRLIAALQYS